MPSDNNYLNIAEINYKILRIVVETVSKNQKSNPWVICKKYNYLRNCKTILKNLTCLLE
uniref:Uncharacterized protein n=1 Tax=Bacteriophage sp. TaxID=38018 RepID=A0A7G8LRI2_9VIRU|nr:MAG: hypothetical protein [Bacteriophage sp.]